MMKKHFGFTLMELIVVIVILSIIAIIATRILFTGFNAYITTKNVTDATAQARLGMERMTIDIRNVRSPLDVTTISTSQFTFTDTSANSISYTRSGTSLMRNSQVLADGVSGLTFTYLDENGSVTGTAANVRYVTVKLDITQGGTSFSVTTTIYPRNLP